MSDIEELVELAEVRLWAELLAALECDSDPRWDGIKLAARVETVRDDRRCTCGHLWAERPDGCDCIAPVDVVS